MTYWIILINSRAGYPFADVIRYDCVPQLAQHQAEGRLGPQALRHEKARACELYLASVIAPSSAGG